MRRIAPHPRFLSRGDLKQFRTSRTKSQLAIKPKCAGLDGLFVLMAELIGIDRKTGHARKLMQEVKDLGINPSCLPVAKGVEGVEPNLHPLKQRDALDVVDGNAILQRQTCMVSAQRQTPLGGQSPEEDLHTSSDICLKDLLRIATGCAVQFAIADREGGAGHIQYVFALR